MSRHASQEKIDYMDKARHEISQIKPRKAGFTAYDVLLSMEPGRGDLPVNVSQKKYKWIFETIKEMLEEKKLVFIGEEPSPNRPFMRKLYKYGGRK